MAAVLETRAARLRSQHGIRSGAMLIKRMTSGCAGATLALRRVSRIASIPVVIPGASGIGTTRGNGGVSVLRKTRSPASVSLRRVHVKVDFFQLC